MSTDPPRCDEIDVFGLSDRGKVREQNQDQFLVASLHRTMRIRSTSLPEGSLELEEGPSMACLLMVADGAGGHAGGREASALATQALVQYVASTADACQSVWLGEALLQELERAVQRCHRQVRERGEGEPKYAGMATTLTLVSVVWPWAYVIQVGDSRCYLLRDGELRQLTTDQTLAQLLHDGGIPSHEVDALGLRHVLSSAIGVDLAPVTTRMRLAPSDRLLLCTDGLTNHVSDREIEEALERGIDARDISKALVKRALQAGGTDNVTVVAARMPPTVRDDAR